MTTTENTRIVSVFGIPAVVGASAEPAPAS